MGPPLTWDRITDQNFKAHPRPLLLWAAGVLGLSRDGYNWKPVRGEGGARSSCPERPKWPNSDIPWLRLGPRPWGQPHGVGEDPVPPACSPLFSKHTGLQGWGDRRQGLGRSGARAPQQERRASCSWLVSQPAATGGEAWPGFLALPSIPLGTPEAAGVGSTGWESRSVLKRASPRVGERGRREAEEPASLPAHPVLNHVLVWELGGGSVNVNKPFFNGPNNTGDDVLVYGPFFNATWKPLS